MKKRARTRSEAVERPIQPEPIQVDEDDMPLSSRIATRATGGPREVPSQRGEGSSTLPLTRDRAELYAQLESLLCPLMPVQVPEAAADEELTKVLDMGIQAYHSAMKVKVSLKGAWAEAARLKEEVKDLAKKLDAAKAAKEKALEEQRLRFDEEYRAKVLEMEREKEERVAEKDARISELEDEVKDVMSTGLIQGRAQLAYEVCKYGLSKEGCQKEVDEYVRYYGDEEDLVDPSKAQNTVVFPLVDEMVGPTFEVGESSGQVVAVDGTEAMEQDLA